MAIINIEDDLPTARTSLSGYDASVAKLFDQASQNHIGDHARNLVVGCFSLSLTTVFIVLLSFIKILIIP